MPDRMKANDLLEKRLQNLADSAKTSDEQEKNQKLRESQEVADSAERAKIFQELVERELLDLKRPDHQKLTLSVAVDSGDSKLVESVLKEMDFRKMGPEINEALHKTVANRLKSSPGSMEVLKSMISMGVKMEGRDAMDETVLHVAALKGDNQLCRVLLAGGADPIAKTKFGRTPIDNADQRGYSGTRNLIVKSALENDHILHKNKVKILEKLPAGLMAQYSKKYEIPVEGVALETKTKSKTSGISSGRGVALLLGSLVFSSLISACAGIPGRQTHNLPLVDDRFLNLVELVYPEPESAPVPEWRVSDDPIVVPDGAIQMVDRLPGKDYSGYTYLWNQNSQVLISELPENLGRELWLPFDFDESDSERESRLENARQTMSDNSDPLEIYAIKPSKTY